MGFRRNISASCQNYIKNPVDFTTVGDIFTFGNGDIMRNTAITIAYNNNLYIAISSVENQSKVTHQGLEVAGIVGYLLILGGIF